MKINRAFVGIAEGQVHYRHTPDSPSNTIPLVLLHMSPVASGFLIPLMAALGEKDRQLIAPDTLGNGDSAPLEINQPEISDFADGLVRFLDAICIDRAHFYGVRTGAMIATELAIRHKSRVETVILDELLATGGSETTGAIGEPCPPIDAYGSQLHWAWHVMRDHAIWYPWWHRHGSNRIKMDLPSAKTLHNSCVELLKAIETFHFSYNAAMRWPRRDRMPLISVPTMIPHEPTYEAFPDVRPTAEMIEGAELVDLPAGDISQESKAYIIRRWLQSREVSPTK